MAGVVDAVARQAIKNHAVIVGKQLGTAGTRIPDVHPEHIKQPGPDRIDLLTVELPAIGPDRIGANDAKVREIWI
jgi:hypothetical protein